MQPSQRDASAGAWSVFVGAETHDITLIFARELAPLILNAEHHAGEKKKAMPGGKVKYQVRLSSLEEIPRWVVGFGGGVQVVEPVELREGVRKLAQAALQRSGPAD